MKHSLFLVAAAWTAVSSAALAKDGPSLDEDGLTIKAADGELELTIGGRLHLDAARFDVRDAQGTDADVRRARLELGGRVAKKIRFRVDREFAGAGGWRNVWLSVEPVEDLQFRGGNVIVPFSMEEIQSSNDSALMERSLLSAIAPGFGLGGFGLYSGRNFTVAAGYFGNALSNEDERAKGRGSGLAGRASFVPLLGPRGFVHLAAAVESRELDADEQLRFTAKPGSRLAPTLLSTGGFRASSLRSVGGEAAYSVRSLLLQGQYARVSAKRDLLGNSSFNGWYAQASYVLTGEKYDYSRSIGAVSGVDVRRRGNAVEVAARVSGLDLRDGSILAGNARTYTVGANYYLNRNVRLMLNYAHSNVDDAGSAGASSKADVIAGRFQVGF